MLSLYVLILTKSPVFCVIRLISLVLSAAFKLGELSMLWFSYSLVILFVGGIIVLFLYVCSIVISNKILFSLFSKYQVGTLGGLGLMVITIAPNLNIGQFDTTALLGVYRTQNLALLSYLLILLLVVLLVRVTLVTSKKGPLKPI